MAANVEGEDEAGCEGACKPCEEVLVEEARVDESGAAGESSREPGSDGRQQAVEAEEVKKEAVVESSKREPEKEVQPLERSESGSESLAALAQLLPRNIKDSQGFQTDPCGDADQEHSLTHREIHDRIKIMEQSWTGRMDTVKCYIFDLEGNVATRDETKRVPGGHTLQEATILAHSTDSGQQEVALLLIASVLEKAMFELQTQGLSSTVTCSSVKDTDVDWQAVWMYAIGSELELASVLRMALEDTNMSVVTACAKALHALLSCSANEMIFDLQEGIWPGNKSAFTAPVFRRQTKQEDGLIGGGRWKYSVNSSELHPTSQTLNPLSDNDEDKEVAGDEATVTRKDIAAGLIRMGVLTRIQHILEVEQLRAVDELLLGVVIALSRHSPAAAKAVMRCPRLMDSIIQRFLLTDEDLDLGLRSAHNKAIQLLKILSQASTANCIRFAETGALQVAQCELYQQGYPLPSHPKLGEESFKGICATVIECLRLWRVCINHQIGIALFPDIYPALCYWLAPLSSKEISSRDTDDMLSLAQESYSLLERLAWTLPILHTEGSVHLNWAWNVAVPLVETAFGWLSKDRIAAVCKEIYMLSDSSQREEDSFRLKLIGTMASVLHFLATVCEMFTDSGAEESSTNGSQNISLPPFVRQLALLLVTNGSLMYRGGGLNPTNEKNSLLGTLCYLRNRVDDDTAMAATSCLHGLVRLVSVIDQLSSKAEEKSGAANPTPEETEAHKILARGLVISADSEFRDLLYLVGQEMIANAGLVQSFEINGRAGLSPGLGLGWGQVGGGVWSKAVLHAKGVARLVTELLEILPVKPEGDTKEGSVGGKQSVTSDLRWRISCGLSVAGIAGPGDGEIVHRICSNVLLHPDTLALVLHGSGAALELAKASKSSVGRVATSDIDTSLRTPNLPYEDISKVLSEHYRKVWLCGKPMKSSHSRRSLKHKNVKEKTSLISTKLSTLSEESAKLAEARNGAEGLANEMVAEWAKQRLPLPSHWVFSPMATNLTGLVEGNEGANEPECTILENGKFTICTGRQMEMEDSIKYGLTWLLGLEALSQSMSENEENVLSAIPVVRKVHALSSLFVLGGDMFLKEELKDYVIGLQQLFGRLLDIPSEAKQGSRRLLDFGGEIDGSYSAFSETLTRQFSTASTVDTGFARQVALYLRQDLAASIRLSTWRVLADADSLKLLPPLADCCGDSQGYLFPFEKNQEVIDSYVSAWASGALDAAAAQDSMSFALALHHIAAFLFEEESAAEKYELRKVSRSLVESFMQRPQQQDLLRQLVEYQLSSSSEPLGTEELERRLGFLQVACEGDNISAQVKQLRKLSLRSTPS